jgi:hypothetical protein
MRAELWVVNISPQVRVVIEICMTCAQTPANHRVAQMGITKLTTEDSSRMDSQPELAMNIQIARSDGGYVVVVAGRIAIEYDEAVISELARLNELMRPSEHGLESYAQNLERWTNGLKSSPRLTPTPISDALAVLGFIHLGPRFPFPPPPIRPPVVYGHLPFQGIASGADVYYRYEPYPTSRRINPANNRVMVPDTYASPQLDAVYVNSGLGAVARYALPQLLPARWRYELRPPSGTPVYYGASVPLYGQSGGGVEVSFPIPFTNSGPIPPPHILPIM